MAKRGAPSKRTPEVEERLIEGISEGIPLQPLCREEGCLPGGRCMTGWRATLPLPRIARAREVGADAIASESLDIVDEEPQRGPDGKIDSGWVAHQKLRAEHRLKLLAKWSPKVRRPRGECSHGG